MRLNLFAVSSADLARQKALLDQDMPMRVTVAGRLTAALAAPPRTTETPKPPQPPESTAA